MTDPGAWQRNIRVLRAHCTHARQWHTEGDDALELAAIAAMCADDGVSSLEYVSAETMARYASTAHGLSEATTPGYLACWRRYSEQ